MTTNVIHFNEQMPLHMLPITDATQLRRALMHDRGQRFSQRANEVRQAARLIIDRNFEHATEIYAELTPKNWVPSPEAATHPAAKLYQLWGYVDGLLYGKTEGILSCDEVTALRREWNDKCDQAFGDKVGEVLKLQGGVCR